MNQSHFVALPPEHVAPSQLTWRVTRAIVARDQGWSLQNLSVSRRWRFQVGRARWIAMAYVSLHFNGVMQNRGSAVYAIYFYGKGSTSALESSPLFQDLRLSLGRYHWSTAGRSLVVVYSDSRPSAVLAELDRITAAFGSADRHRAPSSRSRAIGKRLASIVDAVLARRTWELETLSVWIWRFPAMAMNISAMPSGARARSQLSSMLHADRANGSGTARLKRAVSRGYKDHASKEVPQCALGKLQTLSLRAALAEARFLESELSA